MGHENNNWDRPLNDAGALVEDPRIKKITFTGSPPVGWEIKRRAGKKRVTLELGGNAAVIVEPDAALDLAAQKICMGAFAFSGQVCISVQRVYVHRSCFDAFSKLLQDEAAQLKMGDPLDDSINFGPMIDEDNAIRVESWIREALDQGAQCIAGGKREHAMVAPTILTGVDPGARISSCEAFGPVLVLEPYDDFNTALDWVNDSEFGLQAGIFTSNMDKEVSYRRDAGIVQRRVRMFSLLGGMREEIAVRDFRVRAWFGASRDRRRFGSAEFRSWAQRA